MAETAVTQQYYIETKSSPADDRARVLKYGDMFAVFDRLGDIQTTGLGEQGIFFKGTRHLSSWCLDLWNARPLLLSSTVETSNFLFTADLANLDVLRNGEVVIPRGTIHLRRSRFLWKEACYEELEFVNHGLSELTIPVRVTFAADFTDIFEVRGMSRSKRGSLAPAEVGSGSWTTAYKGLDDVVRTTTICCDPLPDHMSAEELTFHVPLKPKQRRVYQLTVYCTPEAKRNSTYTWAISPARQELSGAQSKVPKIYSSNSRFNDWVARSAADVEMMTLGNPEVDYPYAGVPWFSTVFGRDGIITALQMLWLNPDFAKGVLKYLAEAQASEVDPANEAEPGKILHEMRRGEMARLREVPFAHYYGSVDSTPLFVMLAGAYFDQTGDLEFLKTLWPHVERALEWIDVYGDSDKDGFVDYARRSANGLVQQGWKDSNDSVFHADGRLADAPIALCEVQGYVYAAKQAASRMAAALGLSDRADKLRRESEDLYIRFNEAFWCEDLSTYAIALDGNKRPCRVRSSNAGHCLYSGIVPAERAPLVAKTLMDESSFSGWGIRTIATTESRYNPLSYHNGSVWPHDNSIIASGFARYKMKEHSGQVMLAMLDVSSMVELHRLPELFCGITRRHGEGPTLYPVACAPQAWASAAVFLILQACLGVEIQNSGRRVVFHRPFLPDGIPQLSIEQWKIGNVCLDIFFERRNYALMVHVANKTGDLEVVV